MNAIHPLFTVAIPTCNGHPFITSALQGILAQDEIPSFDLIISDDRSDDTTLNDVRSLAPERARIHQNPTRLGLAGNWNKCLVLAQTPFVTIFHQDDVMHPGHLSAHVRAFAADDQIGLVASAVHVVDAQNNPIPPGIIPPAGLGPTDLILVPGELAPLLAAGNPLRCSAISLRLSACHAVGPFDPTYRYVLDCEYWLRISRSWKVAWLAKPTVAVRWHPSSETHRFKAGTADLEETARLMDQLFTIDLINHSRTRPLRRAAIGNLARAYLHRAHDALHAGQPALACHALRRALRLSPRIIATLLLDPRTALQMAALTVAPRLATRWFTKS